MIGAGKVCKNPLAKYRPTIGFPENELLTAKLAPRHLFSSAQRMVTGQRNIKPLVPKLYGLAIGDIGGINNESDIQTSAANLREMLGRAALKNVNRYVRMLQEVPL